jgi:chemotaxis protein MotB
VSTLVAAGALLGGCGYSEEEWQAQLDKYTRIVGEHQKAGAKIADLDKQLKEAQERIAQLEKDLEATGVDVKKLNADLATRNTELSSLAATLEERDKALAEYKARAEQLERVKRRFELLRNKLNELTSLGLSVVIRNNRMLISLPGDVLFASGQDALKREGESILDKVAEIINADSSLRARYYQVGGHTDDQPLKGGIFRDNWGLSLMRARTVLVYLIDPKHGALPATRWSAAGFADTDPLGGNETEDGKQKNRRCEIVVVPSAEEMLDLKAIAQ